MIVSYFFPEEPVEYKPQPKACEDFSFIAQKLREIEKEREEILNRKTLD